MKQAIFAATITLLAAPADGQDHLGMQCISDEDCLQHVDSSSKHCSTFCVDGYCSAWDKPFPPVLTFKTNMKVEQKNFKLREGEELERVFKDPPHFYQKDLMEGRFFEVTEGSDTVLEVKYPSEYFKMAAHLQEESDGSVGSSSRDEKLGKSKTELPGEDHPNLDDNLDLASLGLRLDGTDVGPAVTNPFANPFANRRGLRAIQNQGVDRRHVTNHEDYPWRMNGRLSMGCTASLIGNRVLLTAAHCVWDRETNSWGGFPQFSAGQDGNDRPYGSKQVWKMTIPAGYQTCSTLSSCRAHDWAVLVLRSTEALNVGYFGFSTSKGYLNLAGYPQSKNRELWYDHCPLHSDEGNWIKHRCDTEPGNSGSAIYRISNGNRYVVAVHGGGYTNQWNRGADVAGTTSSAGRLYDRMLDYRNRYG